MEGLAITTDLPCVGCGYNLRMQPVEGTCPECGLAAKMSLDQTILKWGSQRLRRIAQGMRLQAATAAVILVVLPAGILLERFAPSLGMSSVMEGTLTFATMTVAGVFHTVGAWKATSVPENEKHLLSYRLCRLSGLMIPLVLLGLTVQVSLQRRPSGPWSVFGLMMSILMMAWAVYGERGATCWTIFHRRGGLGSKEGLGKWTLRGFAAVVLLLASCMSAMFGLQAAVEWELFHIDPRFEQRFTTAMLPVLLGVLIAMGILLILIIVALFRGANRTMELAPLAEKAEREGFMAPLASANDAPSCS